MDTGHRSPARLLAPIALIVCSIALVAILTTAGEDDRSKSSSEATRAEQRDLRVKRRQQRSRDRSRRTAASRGVYVVKTGDTLGGIAEKTGVKVEKLQELNPTLDPQALVSGQRIKLR